jgi:hypothetical protein
MRPESSRAEILLVRNRLARRSSFVISLCAAITAGLFLAARSAEATPPARNPHGSFRGACSACHDETRWKPAHMGPRFRHTRFPLRGTHATAACSACHSSLDFSAAPTTCATCHDDVHRGELGVDCARCHTSRSFIDRIAMVREHRLTRFPLQGAHASVDCERCHRPEPSGQMRFVGTEVECVSCHDYEYQATTYPNHAAAGYSLRCQTCHTMFAWEPARLGYGSSRMRARAPGAAR